MIAPETLPGLFGPEDLTIIINGNQINNPDGTYPQLTPAAGAIEAEVVKSIDTGADGWVIKISWEIGKDPSLEASTRPYGYEDAQVYIGGKLQINGRLYRVSPGYSKAGRTKVLGGASYTKDIVDSDITPPYEFQKVTLEALAANLIAQSGLSIPVSSETSTGGIFDTVTAKENETIFALLARLGRQRGVVVTKDAQGGVLFASANTKSVPVATIKEGTKFIGLAEISANYDGGKRFNKYVSKNQTPLSPNVLGIAIDPQIVAGRVKNIKATDTTLGNSQVSANWVKNRHLLDAEAIEFPVPGWIDESGSLWHCNSNIIVDSETIFAPGGKMFFIRSVKYQLNGGKRISVLSLVPPEAYELI